MKQFRIHKSIMKYLTDKDLSLNAKGFLTIVLFNEELPGIGLDENITTSLGSNLICLCVPLAILDKAANGSP